MMRIIHFSLTVNEWNILRNFIDFIRSRAGSQWKEFQSTSFEIIGLSRCIEHISTIEKYTDGCIRTSASLLRYRT